MFRREQLATLPCHRSPLPSLPLAIALQSQVMPMLLNAAATFPVVPARRGIGRLIGHLMEGDPIAWSIVGVLAVLGVIYFIVQNRSSGDTE